jgi:hypothetical protein
METAVSLSQRRVSRARFLRMIGVGAGLSFIPSSLSVLGAGSVLGSPANILADGQYPIGLWWPPPPEKTTVYRYRQIAEAGFNFVIGGNGVSNDAENTQALKATSANGLRFLLTDGKLHRTITDSTYKAAAATTPEAQTPSLMRYLLEQEGSEPASRAASEPREETTPYYSASGTIEDEVRLRIRELLDHFGNNPALAGLNLYDEPGSTLFKILGFARQVLRRQAPRELPYVDVWPSYATPDAMGTRTYEGYLERYMRTVHPPLLCFSHYPLLSGGGTTGDYFYNWATIRKISLRFGVPSWVFIQSVGFDSRVAGFQDRRKPNEAEIRWQVNVSLAYGAKGIQYFTYWTPKNTPGAPVRFTDALISRGGRLTALYDYTKRVNSYLRTMGKALLPLISESVVHAREERLPWGAKPFKADGYISSVSGSPIILGRSRKPGVADARYLFVANRSSARAAKSRLTLSRSVRGVFKLDTSTGRFTKVAFQASHGRRYVMLRLSLGGARLYQLHT